MTRSAHFAACPISNHAQKKCQSQSNQNLSKRRGRPKKSLESMNVALKNIISEGIDSADLVELPLNSHQALTEEVISSKKDRKRKWETIGSTGSILAANASPTSRASPVVIDVAINKVEVEKEKAIPCPPKPDKLAQDKKSRKSQPKRFISPFLPFTVSGKNERVEKEQKDKNMNVDQAVPQFQVAGAISSPNHGSNAAEIHNHEDSLSVSPVIEVDPNGTIPWAHKNIEERILVPGKRSRQEHYVPVTLADTRRSHVTVVSSPRLSSGSLSFHKTNYIMDHRAGASRGLTSKNVTFEKQERNTCLSPTYEAEEKNCMHREQFLKPCKNISGFEYVPSSNPSSPQIVPTEGKRNVVLRY